MSASKRSDLALMLRKLRIAVLLYVLVFVAAGHYLTRVRARSWDTPLWVDVYPVAAETGAGVDGYIESLDDSSFASVETFFAEQAERLGLDTSRPFRIDVAPALASRPPELPRAAGPIDALLWSLSLRWFTTRLVWTSERPRPDVVLYAVYHGADPSRALDDSRALERGMIVVANLFAAPAARATNEVVVAHELLHTVGASDKYDPATTLPIHPSGFAAPDAEPLYPQRRAELMGGRVPVTPDRARIPSSLDEVVVGPVTATEIGWMRGVD